MSRQVSFDPYALFEALERLRASYVVVGAFARIVHGSGEVTHGLDIVPSPRDENLRRLRRAFDELAASPKAVDADVLTAGEPVTVETAAGVVTLVPQPWGTCGYDDIRIRGNRENLGRVCGLRSRRSSTSRECSRPADAAKTHSVCSGYDG